MTRLRSLAVWAAVSAMAAGCATSGAKTGAAGKGAGKGAARAPASKPADAKAPVAKPADARTAEARPAEATKAADANAAAPAAGAGRGFWASYDEHMKRMGNRLDESKFLGLRLRPRFSDELSVTDNVFYQDNNEKLVSNLDPPPVGNPATPMLGKPRGKVSDIVNTATLGLDFDMPLNTALVPLVGTGTDRVKVFGASVTDVEYLLHADSPNAINYEVHLDLPALVNAMLARLMTIDANRHALYVRLEGNYSVITDPLDVAKLEASSTNPTFNNTGERNSFRRTEWFVKGTVGWKSPLFDSKLSYRHYRLQLEDNSLKPADHIEQETYGEVGHHLMRSDHRIYGFGEYTKYNFDNRRSYDPTNPNESDTQALRDFAKIRTGMGWEGPVASKKIHGGAELYFLATEVFHEGPAYLYPVNTVLGTGLPSGKGNQRFDERGMLAGKANLAYRPYVTKGTQLQVDYERNVDFSVVAQDKVVDKGSITFTHPINDRLTGEAFLGETMENMQHREKRLYSEFGLGARYKIAAYTELSLRYTLRHMRSRREPVSPQSDQLNRPYYLKADGDFTANIVSLGISIQF